MKIGKNFQLGGEFLRFIQLGIAFLGVLLVSLIVSRFVYPFGVGTWESFNWIPATHILEGKNPYSFAFSPPYSMSPYGFVYYALVAIGVKLFGYQMWFGRFLSVLAYACCLTAVCFITRKLEQGKEAAWMACLAGLALFPAVMWISVMRPDLIAAAFAFSALALAFCVEKDKKIELWRLVLIISLSASAFFTKPTFWLEAAIIFLRFLQLKKWPSALIYFIGMTILVFGGMILLNHTSSGGYFWQHFTHAQRLPFSLNQSASVFVGMLKIPTFSISLVFLIIFAFHKSKLLLPFNRLGAARIIYSPKGLIFLYIVVSLIWSFLSSGRIGGGANYYIENSFLLAIGIGLIFEHFKRNGVPKFAFAIIIMLVCGSAFQFVRVFRGEYYRWQSLSYYREVFQTVGNVVPPNSNCISIYPELVVWNGCAFNFDDFEEYVGTWSPELIEIFEREIEMGRFAAIVWMDDKFMERFPNYRLLKMKQAPPERFFPVYVYVPEK